MDLKLNMEQENYVLETSHGQLAFKPNLVIFLLNVTSAYYYHKLYFDLDASQRNKVEQMVQTREGFISYLPPEMQQEIAVGSIPNGQVFGTEIFAVE